MLLVSTCVLTLTHKHDKQIPPVHVNLAEVSVTTARVYSEMLLVSPCVRSSVLTLTHKHDKQISPVHVNLAEVSVTTALVYPEMLLVSPCVRSSVLTLTHKHDKQISPVHVNLAEVSVTTALVYPEMLLVSPCVRSSVLTLTHKHDKQIPPVHVNLAEVSITTALVYPEMLPVSPCVRSSVLTLTHKHDKQIPPVHVNLAEVIALQKPIEAKVWAVPVPVFDCGKEVSEWFNNLLGRPSSTFRLVYYATQQPRLLRSSTNRIYKFTKNDTGALPDETPFNLINEASVDDLNTRLQLTDRVSHRSFRPNFILQGALPYAEDNWKFLKIGNVVFEILKPCTRCVLTTIDPETGVRNPNTEPLETLKSYRQIEDPEVRRSAGNSPRMGLQLTLRSAPGQWVTLDDPIYVA
ncbi:mitochondrial amidoxime-reducing component 1-like isoform X1 [Cydia pomonella]|uniref:mitochondrial amidoxime-reducing component 1-like isoform X1 n=1 Tax=Cydia pomonella TaxID=82600 RepID=UPI002ADD86DE|nr:mitochondrial amidoxime-reducing component 1-like isoform X1 [Cydia pomonella]